MEDEVPVTPSTRKYKKSSKVYHDTSIDLSKANNSSKRTFRKRMTFHGQTSQMPDDKDITEQNDVETEKFNTESTDLKNSSKIFQTCSVNIEELTPGKLDLVKTADPSLLHIKNDISERKKKKKALKEAKANKIWKDIYLIDNDISSKNDVKENEKGEEATAFDDVRKIMEKIKMQEDRLNSDQSVLNTTFTLSDEHINADNNTSSTVILDKKRKKRNSTSTFALPDEERNKCGSTPIEKVETFNYRQSMNMTRTPRKKWSINKTIFDFRQFDSEDNGADELTKNATEKLSRSFTNPKVSTLIFNDKNELDSVPEKESKTEMDVDESLDDLANNSTYELNISDSIIFNDVTSTSTRTFENVTLRRPHSRQSPMVAIANTSPPFAFVSNETSQVNVVLNNLSPKKPELKRQSITKRLAKPKRSNENSKILSDKISKNSRVSSRTPKLSGSKSVQLYEFLTDNKKKENIVDLESPPSGTSTPKILKKHVMHSLLKSTLKKEKYNVTFDDNVSRNNNSINCNTESSKTKTSRVKMPNFAQMHQKHFDKMESIVDYKQRTNERAKLLLSGAKPVMNNSSSSAKKNTKCNKQLMTVFNKRETNTNYVDERQNDFMALPTTPSIKPSNKSLTLQEVQNISNNFTSKNIPSIHRTPLKEKQVRINVTPRNNVECPKLFKKTPFKETSILSKSTNPSKTPVFKKTNAFVANLENNSKVQKSDTSRSGYTRFGFQVAVKPKKHEIMNAVANKCRIPKKDNKDEKRTIIKGVRSNRRFDLLMKMRQK